MHPRWQASAWPLLAGWMGHADTFAFRPDYEPAPGVARFQVGTPAVVANALMACAAELWRGVNPGLLLQRHRSLTDTLVRLVDEQCASLGVALAGPREHARRGGHVALRFQAPQANVSALGQALVAAGVVVSTRQPDALRLAPHPMVAGHAQLWVAVQRLVSILHTGQWRQPAFQGRSV